MPDPNFGAGESSVLGVKLAWLVAGFAGGVVSLSFVRNLTWFQAALAVFTGAVSAGYGTPILMHYMSINSPELSNGAAFAIGITAMNIIPGLLKLSEIFRRDPGVFVGGGK